MATRRSNTITIKRGERRYDFDRSRQYTTTELGRMFRVQPETIWLRGDYDDRAYLPGENNAFDFSNVEDYDVLQVEGDTCGTSSLTTQAGTPSRSPSTSDSTLTAPAISSAAGTSQMIRHQAHQQFPGFTSVVHQKKNPSSYSLKIVKATITSFTSGGRPQFEKLGQLFLELTDSNSNLPHVLTSVQREWGVEYVVVTPDGLEITDSSGTQGPKFWKAQSRKFFAVCEDDLLCSRSTTVTRKRPRISLEDPGPADRATTLDNIAVQLSDLSKKVCVIENHLSDVLLVTKEMKVPLALRNALRNGLHCKICRIMPMRPPIIFGKCCRSIIGWQECVDGWFNVDNPFSKSCPSCNTERAFAETMRISGLDDMLEAIAPIFEDIN